jgi:hypothetical protein
MTGLRYGAQGGKPWDAAGKRNNQVASPCFIFESQWRMQYVPTRQYCAAVQSLRHALLRSAVSLLQAKV